MTVDTITDPLARAARRADQTARFTQSVHDLLERRPELVGVFSLSDLVHDGVRWAA